MPTPRESFLLLQDDWKRKERKFEQTAQSLENQDEVETIKDKVTGKIVGVIIERPEKTKGQS